MGKRNNIVVSRDQTCIHTDEVDLIFTHCANCKRRIIIGVPMERMKQDMNYGNYWTCNICVPENSAIRNDLDEPYLTDMSRKLFCEET